MFIGGEKKIRASAGNRTRIDCLEGNHADLYTTDACVKCALINYLYQIYITGFLLYVYYSLHCGKPVKKDNAIQLKFTITIYLPFVKNTQNKNPIERPSACP